MDNRRVLFLDRDGVINKKALPHQYITRWQEFEILPGVCRAIRKCNKAGYYVAIISNQQGIAKGICSLEQIDRLHRKMLEALKKQDAVIDKIYICPHENGKCECRKPKPGMFYIAEEQLLKERKQKVDKEHSWMIGDSISDVKAGQAYGVKTIWICSQEICDIHTKQEIKANYTARNLCEAVNLILPEKEIYRK